MSPEISYILSLHNRPGHLRSALASLANQTHRNFECIITDNTSDDRMAKRHRLIVEWFNQQDSEDGISRRFFYHRTVERLDAAGLVTKGKIKVSDCYWSAEYGVAQSKGAWLAFPCEDTQLVPGFGQIMLSAAHENQWDFVLCGNVIAGPDCNGGLGYYPWKMTIGRVTKTTYLIRAECFQGFTGKLDRPGSVLADNWIGREVAARGLRWGVVNQTLLIHN